MDKATMIIVGDCIEVLKTLEANQYDLIFADPPYNIGIDYGEGKWADSLADDDYHIWSMDWIHACRRVLSPKGSIWVLINDVQAGIIECNLYDEAFSRRSCIIWHETFSQYQEGNFTNEHRHLFYFVKDESNYHWFPDAIRIESQRQKNGDKRANPKGRVPGNVWEIPRLCGNHPGRVDWHPCQLPQAPLTRILRACLPPASEQVCEILELFSGSGSMGIAAKAEGHNYTGIEKNPEYARRANERIEAYVPQMTLLGGDDD